MIDDVVGAVLVDEMQANKVPVCEVTFVNEPTNLHSLIKIRYYPMLDAGHCEYVKEIKPEELSTFELRKKIVADARVAYIMKMREVLEKYENK